MIIFNILLIAFMGHSFDPSFDPKIPGCPQLGVRKVRVKTPITRGPRAGSFYYTTKEEPIPLPECPIGEDASTSRACRRIAKCSLDTLRYYSGQFDVWSASYFEQLVNQDPVAAPQVMAKLNKAITEINFTGAEVDLEVIMSVDDLEAYKSIVLRGRSTKNYDGIHLTTPELPGILATRLPEYQLRGAEAVDAALANSRNKEIIYGAVAPSTRAPSQLHYPTESAASNEMLRCTSGGFFNRSRPLEMMPGKRNNGLRNTEIYIERTNGRATGRFEVHSANMPGAQWNHHTQQECNTPKRVSLSLNGEILNFSCNPTKGSISSDMVDSNTAKALDGQRMCDPILYAFHPREFSGDSKAALASCHHPPSNKIGRFGSYTENIAGRIGTEILHALPPVHSMGMAIQCPGCLSDRELESKCDRMARLEIAPNVKVPPELKGVRGDYVLAAQLAIENPRVWDHKIKRFKEYCSDMKRNHESTNCNTIGLRMNRIQTVIEQLKSITPAPTTPDDGIKLMSGQTRKDSAG